MLASRPVGYFSAAWLGSTGNRDVVLQNIRLWWRTKVKQAIRDHSYPMACVPNSFQAKPQHVTPPVLCGSLFKLPNPQMNGELPLWESTMEQGLLCGKAYLPDTEEHKGMTWQQVVGKHKAEFNPSSKVAKRKVRCHLASALVEICKCCELWGWGVSRRAGPQAHWPTAFMSRP